MQYFTKNTKQNYETKLNKHKRNDNLKHKIRSKIINSHNKHHVQWPATNDDIINAPREKKNLVENNPFTTHQETRLLPHNTASLRITATKHENIKNSSKKAQTQQKKGPKLASIFTTPWPNSSFFSRKKKIIMKYHQETKKKEKTRQRQSIKWERKRGVIFSKFSGTCY